MDIKRLIEKVVEFANTADLYSDIEFNVKRRVLNEPTKYAREIEYLMRKFKVQDIDDAIKRYFDNKSDFKFSAISALDAASAFCKENHISYGKFQQLECYNAIKMFSEPYVPVYYVGVNDADTFNRLMEV